MFAALLHRGYAAPQAAKQLFRQEQFSCPVQAPLFAPLVLEVLVSAIVAVSHRLHDLSPC